MIVMLRILFEKKKYTHIQKGRVNEILIYSTYKTLVVFKRKKTQIFTSPSDTSVKT